MLTFPDTGVNIKSQRGKQRVPKRKETKTMTRTRYFVYNKNDRYQGERKTEAEAKAWVEKNARYNWHYEVYVEESHEPTWWEMEGYMVNPENVKYNYPDD